LKSSGSKHFRFINRRVEVKNADVRVEQVRRTGYPYVRRDAVLIGKPEQRSDVAHDRMTDRPALLWDLDPLQPLRKALGDILLHEPFLANAGRVSFHRDRA
jgi:hypothetical protein